MAVNLARGFKMRPRAVRIMLGTPLIYLPILTTVPFVFLGMWIVRLHLYLLGARNVKRYRDFLPEWISHRYIHRTQIVSTRNPLMLAHYKFFWIFNCKLYCPFSVALFRYTVYLVKIVENWWCPFAHSRKEEYADAAIDASYWHLNEKRHAKLDPADEANPIWNRPAEP